jgi:hypothetical protein
MAQPSKPTLTQFYGLRNGRTSFSLDPDRNIEDRGLLFGDEYNDKFETIYEKLEELANAKLGYKAVLWGDFGLGKTHFLRHLQYIIENPAKIGKSPIAVLPLYVKCSAFRRRAPFADFAGELIRAFPAQQLGTIVSQYLHSKGAEELLNVANSESIASAFAVVGNFPGLARQNAIRWLCGEHLTSSDLENIEAAGAPLSGVISKGKDFAGVLAVLAELVSTVEGKVLTYLVDEGEKLRNVTEPDAAENWLDCLMAITELKKLGLIFTIGAQTRDRLPLLLVEEEIERRIDPTGYISMDPLAESDLIDFVKDTLAAFVDVSSSTAAAANNINPGSAEAEIWPLNQAGLDAFVEYGKNGPQANKPSSVLNGMQTLILRAYRIGATPIDADFVEGVLPIE